MGRLLRGIFKLALISAVVAGVVTAARKLMGGLGPAPGSAEAPKEWPSLVPEPTAPEPTPSASSNGAEPVSTPSTAGVAEPPPATDVENGPTL